MGVLSERGEWHNGRSSWPVNKGVRELNLQVHDYTKMGVGFARASLDGAALCGLPGIGHEVRPIVSHKGQGSLERRVDPLIACSRRGGKGGEASR